MYLSSFYKLKFERYAFNAKMLGAFLPAAGLWAVWLMYPSLYNMVYTDLIPPERGVERRIVEDI